MNLAGNGLSGTIGRVSSMKSLLNLTLSHNYLSGVIPNWLQEKNMNLLDLSHNKITGTVNGFKNQIKLETRSDSTLKLSVNRLSGDLFHSFQQYSTLDVLSGNLFGCDYTPSKDENSEWTSCGSEEYDQTMIVMGGICGMLVILMIFYCLCLFFQQIKDKK